MEQGTAPRCAVVWTPGSAPVRRDEIAGVATIFLPTLPTDDDTDWVPLTAIALSTALGDAQAVTHTSALSLILIFRGEQAAFAPYIGFAQRAARRSVIAYVLINPQLPRPGVVSDWPDAPVYVVLTPDAPDHVRAVERDARLRGWPVHTSEPGDVLDAIVIGL